MKLFKKSIAVVLAVLMAISMMPFTALADDVSFTKVTSVDEITEENISTCTTEAAKAWALENWDDVDRSKTMVYILYCTETDGLAVTYISNDMTKDYFSNNSCTATNVDISGVTEPYNYGVVNVYLCTPAAPAPTPSYAAYIPTADDDADALEAKQVSFNGSKWLIIEDNSASEGTVTLLVADTSFGNSAFSASGTDYSTSTVRAQLDSQTAVGGSFYEVADAIKSVDLSDVGVTNAKLYLLSESEAAALPVNVRAFAFNNNLGGSWWLRSESSAGKSAKAVVGQDYSGKTAGTILGVTRGSSIGIRPALQLDLAEVDFDATTKAFSLKGEPAPAVAEVNGTQYDSLQAAIAAANTGNTVKLLSDAILTETLVIADDKDFTLDLNGNDITGDINDPLVKNNGKIVVDDSSEAPGHIYNTNIEKQGNAAFVNYGTANIKNGYFGDKNSLMDDNNAVNRGAGFDNLGTAVIDGGYFTACDNYTNPEGGEPGYAYAIINSGDLTINNATVYGKNNGNISNSGTIVINDGTFNLNRKAGTPVFYTLYNSGAQAETTVNGGTFTNSSNNKKSALLYTDEGVMEINGGEFSYVNTLEASEGAPTISGGSFSAQVPQDYCVPGYAPVLDTNTGEYVVERDASDTISISTADEIDVNLYLGETGNEATVEYTFNASPDEQGDDQQTVSVDFASLPEVNGKRKLAITVAPAQIRDNIDITVKNAAGEEIRSYEDYSVAAYCDEIIAGNYSENVKTLAKAVLDYGKATSALFGYNTDAYANEAYYNTDPFDFSVVYNDFYAQASGVTVDEVRYVAKNVPDLRFVVDYDEATAANLGAYAISNIGHQEYPVKFAKDAATGKTLLCVEGIPAAKLNDAVVILIFNDDDDYIIYTPLVYAYNASKSDNANLAKLGNAIGYYWQAADAVFNS